MLEMQWTQQKKRLQMSLMQCLWMLVFFVVLQTGCQSGRKESLSQETPLKGNAVDAMRILPITSSTGIVAAVNEPLRFVILDYALVTLPQMDQILFLYREDQKVARVKICGPFRGHSVVADIIEGVATKGDEARAE